jgi:hypothetical protein
VEVEIEESLLGRLAEFFNEFVKAVNRDPVNKYLNEMFDSPSLRIMSMILGGAYQSQKQENGFVVRIARSTFTRCLCKNISGESITRRLKLFARYSWISVRSDKWQDDADGKRTRETQTIIPHEAFLLLFQNGQANYRRDFIRTCLRIAASRENDEQGLTMTVPYGKPETAQYKIEDLPNGDEFNERTTKKNDSAAERKRRNEQYRKWGDEFVAACADIWVEQQCRKGFGTARPAWEAPTRDAAPAVRSERANLVKTFEYYGGAVTGLGWMIYCYYAIKTDDKGKPVYDPSQPYKQSKFTDDPPRAFAKNIQTLINDVGFQSHSRGDWNLTEKTLRGRFGGLIDVSPKDGCHYSDRLGYAFGDVLQPPSIAKG